MYIKPGWLLLQHCCFRSPLNFRNIHVNWCEECFEMVQSRRQRRSDKTKSKVHSTWILATMVHRASLMAISHNLQPPKPYILMAIDLKSWSYTVKLRNRKANCTSYKARPCDFKAILKVSDMKLGNLSTFNLNRNLSSSKICETWLYSLYV